MKLLLCSLVLLLASVDLHAQKITEKEGKRGSVLIYEDVERVGDEFVGTPSLSISLEDKVIFKSPQVFESALGSRLAWSKDETKVAIALPGSKTSNSIRVVDVLEQKKELPLPDIEAATLAMVGHHRGRLFWMTPIGWSDDDHLIIGVEGNLADSITSGTPELNYSYVFVVQVSTQRIVSVTCNSRHDLNHKGVQPEPTKAPVDPAR
jgi:hypothetical protein